MNVFFFRSTRKTSKIDFLPWFVLFIFLGCKKEKDEVSPTIVLTSPTENNFFNVGEFIGVKGKVTDDNNIEYVKINLLDENYISVLDETAFYPQNKEYTINYGLEINNLKLPSGIYYLNVKASDGENSKSYFIKINLFEIPLALKKIFVVGMNSIDSVVGLNTFPANNFSGDYLNAEVSGYNNQLVFCGEYSGDCVAINGNTFQQDWLVENQGIFGAPYFTCLANNQSENTYFVGLAAGFVAEYNLNGTVTKQIGMQQNYRAKKIFKVGNKILIQESPIGSGTNQLSIYFDSGSFNGSVLINGDILEVSKLDESHYFIFIQESDKLKIYILDSDEYQLSLYYDGLPNGIVKDVEIIDDYSFFFSHQDKIYRYIYGGLGLTIFKEGMGYNILAHEKIGNVLYCSNGETIEVLNPYTNGEVLGVIQTGEIKKILFLYNK